jgi:hypothetical protein
MTEQQHPATDNPSQDRPSEQDLTQRPGGTDDLGGPAAALGTGVEEALTGTQPTEDDEGGAASSPQPHG